MKSKEVNGTICTPIAIEERKITIRAEKTGNYVTLSLADDSRGILIQVPYTDILKVVRGL